MNNKNNIDEISNLLAEFILSENMFSKENIKIKCKVFLLGWQRINNRPKKINDIIIQNADNYAIFKTFIYNYLIDEIGKEKTDNIINKWYKIENVIK